MGNVLPLPVSREVECLDGCGTLITQHQRSPGVWRPWFCDACLSREPLRGGVMLVRPTIPLHLAVPGTGCAIYRTGEAIRCPGELEARFEKGMVIACRNFLGTVAPGYVVRVQILPRNPPPSILAGAVQHCRRCGVRYNLEVEEVEAA